LIASKVLLLFRYKSLSDSEASRLGSCLRLDEVLLAKGWKGRKALFFFSDWAS
jgi:hypothetical protein